jgi:hypothetical protein
MRTFLISCDLFCSPGVLNRIVFLHWVQWDGYYTRTGLCSRREYQISSFTTSSLLLHLDNINPVLKRDIAHQSVEITTFVLYNH